MHPLETELLTQMLSKQDDILQRLSCIETQMKDLVGNGQPGRIARLEKKVEGFARFKYTVIGWISAASVIGGVIGSVAVFALNLLNFWHSHKGK